MSNLTLIIIIMGVIAFATECIVLIILTYKRASKVRKSSIEDIDKMSGEEFEHYLELLYNDLGYKVETTPKRGDFGADLVLNKNKHKVVVQVKRYSKNVGIKAVQEVISAIKYYHSDEAWVITNSYYTKSAIALAESNEVTLIDRDDLIDLIISNKKANSRL